MPTIASTHETHSRRSVHSPQRATSQSGAKPISSRRFVGQTCQAIIGTWKMVSWTVEDLATGAKQDALGPDPAGVITYSADGRVMVLVLKRDRRPPADLIPTSEEKIALYDSMFAYSGTFAVDDEKVIHHIDMSWNQAWTGTNQIRFYELRDGVLTYIGAPAKNPMTGRDCVHTVIFHRSQ
jgi:Lipocalin-like domain